MAVHLPLGEMARAETEVLMLGANNILGPKDGQPIVTPGQDLVLGNFYLNMEETQEEFYNKADALDRLNEPVEAERWRRYGDNEGHVFKDRNEVLMAYQVGVVHLHSRIALPASAVGKTCFSEEQNQKYLITTVGKIIFNNAMPADFPYVNECTSENLRRTPDEDFVPMGTDIKKEIASRKLHSEFKKKDLGNLIAAIFAKYKNGNGFVDSDTPRTSDVLDSLKDLGYQYSMIAGMTVALSDISVAPHKDEMVAEGRKKADVLNHLRDRGLLTPQEWEAQFQVVWNDVKEQVGDSLMKSLPRMSPINMMAVSGARGNKNHFTQLAGMRGLMARPIQSKTKGYQPSIIEVPIYSSFREGMTVAEFFMSSHGVRKGLTDTALKTAESGYLTRRLVDVAQEVVITEEDCGTEKGYLVDGSKAYTDQLGNVKEDTYGALYDNKNGSIIESMKDRISGYYTASDVIDPQSGEVICEADTYLTDDMAAAIAKTHAKVMIRNVFTCEAENGICRKCYGRNMATGNLVEEGEAIGIMAAQAIGEPGTQLTMRSFHSGGVATAGGDITQGLPRVEELFEARTPKGVAVISKIDGEIVDIRDNDNNTGRIVTVANETESIEHKCDLTQIIRPWMKVGTTVHAGEKLTEGQIAPKELLEVAGVAAVQEYILKEVRKVYASQSIDISDKHLEVMIKQMMKKVIVIEPGDSGLSAGQTLSLHNMNTINEDLLDEGKAPAKFGPIMLGISKSAVETDSFLSAASFQETTRVLTEAAIKGKVDHLEGLKENVLIGKLIPAGTGRDFDRDTSRMINQLAQEMIDARHERNARLQEETEPTLPEDVIGTSSDRDDSDSFED